MKKYDISEEDLSVVITIFNKKINNMYKIEILTNVSKDRIYKIYRRCLDIYNEEIKVIDECEVNDEGKKKCFLLSYNLG